MPHLELSDDEAAALATFLTHTIDGDPYPLSPRVQTLRDAKLRPEPARQPLPPPKVYAPPRFIRGRRQR